MYKKITYLFFMCALFPFEVLAQSYTSIVINGVSKHFAVNQDAFSSKLNELNIGLGLEYKFAKEPENSIEWVANTGFFKDSLNGTAFYLGGAGLVNVFSIDRFHIKVGIETTGFYSSEYNQSRPFIALLPVINLGNSDYSVNMTFIPKVSQWIDAGVIFAQLKIKIF